MAQASADVRKQVWKFQEGAVILALRQAGISGQSISWHGGRSPEGMSIEPDVVIGEINSPTHVVFVTHASAERAGEKKFWRGVAEAVEAKRLASHPRLVNVVFAGETKANLAAISENLYDSCVELNKASYGNALTKALLALAKRYGAGSKDDCLEILEQETKARRVAGFTNFAADIRRALTAPVGPFHDTISSSSFARVGRTPRARDTALRRGLCKLFTLSEDVRKSLFSRADPISVPRHAISLGWFLETKGGPRLDDDDIGWVIQNIPLTLAESLLARARETLPVFKQYSTTLNEVTLLDRANAWIIFRFNELKTASGMNRSLEDVYREPLKSLDDVGGYQGAVGNHWLLASLISMLRTETGRADGYGYSKLGQEAGRREVNAAPGTFLAPYLQLSKSIDNGLRADIARVLASHLARLGPRHCAELLGKSIQTTATSTFNYQISGYRHFNPMEWRIGDLLTTAGINYEWPIEHESFLSDKNIGVGSSTGNLIKVLGGRCWIKCQSAYDGRVDKRKELCGRIGAIKLSYSKKELKRIRFCLVIDGYFDQQDIDLLAKAGWDGIFYPDELDKLVTFLK